MTSDDLRYPVGRFAPVAPTAEVRKTSVADLAALPERIRAAVSGLDDRQLDTPYRPGGWTVRQVVHHVADSHMNGFIRVRLALTETDPTIRPYDENAWSTLPDMKMPVAVSLGILDGLQPRWVELYKDMANAEFSRTFIHPEHGTRFTLDEHLQNYGWHSRHHVGHITALRARAGW